MTVSLAGGPQAAVPVVVASRNAVKINAVSAALRQAFPGVLHAVVGADSASGVPDQPFGDEQTLAGAYNRVASIVPQHSGSLLCAIEGGIGWAVPPPASASAALAALAPDNMQQQRQQVAGGTQRQQLECFAWCVVRAPGGACSHARSASFALPPAIAELILEQGLELGAADDAVFGRVKSGQGSGTIGQLTGGLITRTAYYEHAALMALVPLLNPGLYPGFAAPAADAAGEAAATDRS